MARKPETLASTRVNKHLTCAYFEKMSNPYRGGTPDFYYEGSADSMWVEYKWYEVRPRFWNLGKKLSRLQQKWLHRAFKNNRKVAVVAGYPGGYAVFIGDTWTYNDATKDWMTAKDVAQWIEFQVT